MINNLAQSPLPHQLLGSIFLKGPEHKSIDALLLLEVFVDVDPIFRAETTSAVWRRLFCWVLQQSHEHRQA